MVGVLVPQWGLLLAQEETPKLPEPVRAYALMALLGIALLGMLLIVFVLLGGHWVRRIGSYRRGPVVPPDVLVRNERDPENLPSGNPDQPTDETTLTQDTRNA